MLFFFKIVLVERIILMSRSLFYDSWKDFGRMSSSTFFTMNARPYYCWFPMTYSTIMAIMQHESVIYSVSAWKIPHLPDLILHLTGYKTLHHDRAFCVGRFAGN